jgi:putative FmdB family regulatory protein
MPVYEYKCKKCGHAFERLQLRGAEKVRCPRCEGGQVIRLMSPFAIEVPDAICGRLPRGEAREYCSECRQGGGGCPSPA